MRSSIAVLVVPKSYSLSVLDHLLLTPALWNAEIQMEDIVFFYFDFLTKCESRALISKAALTGLVWLAKYMIPIFLCILH